MELQSALKSTGELYDTNPQSKIAFAGMCPALSLALIGSASAEKARGRTYAPGRGTFDKEDLKEAAGGADEYGASSLFWCGCG